MAYIPIAQELSVTYTIESPDAGVSAVLNDPNHADYVGVTTEVTGLDSAEVRESAEHRVESDGGSHGAFYFGRRPITMTVLVHDHTSLTDRATKIDKLRRATTALRDDCNLTWEPSTSPSGEKVFIPLRRQQPFRESGNWNKEIQIALVSEFAIIMSDTLHATAAFSTNDTIENKGNYASYPIVKFNGTSTDPSITDGHGGELLTTGLSLASSETIEIDTLAHTAEFTAGSRNGESGNRFIDFSNITQWPFLEMGNNTFTLSGGGTAEIEWRDAWA